MKILEMPFARHFNHYAKYEEFHPTFENSPKLTKNKSMQLIQLGLAYLEQRKNATFFSNCDGFHKKLLDEFTESNGKDSYDCLSKGLLVIWHQLSSQVWISNLIFYLKIIDSQIYWNKYIRLGWRTYVVCQKTNL